MSAAIKSAWERLRSLLSSGLGRSAGIFFLANVIGAAIPFLLLPVLTRHLTPTDYGILAMFQVLVGITIPFVGINAHGAVVRQYYRREELDFGRYVGNAFLVMMSAALIVGAVYFTCGELIERWTGFPARWMWSIVLLTVANFAVSVATSIWQVEKKAVTYAIFSIALTAIEITAALVLIVGLDWDWEGRVVSRLGATAVFALIALAVLFRKRLLDLRPDPASIRHALRFGVPLIPHTLGMWAITMIDRLFITNMIGVAETGIYVVGVQIAMAVNLLVVGFATAWTPWFYERLQRNDPAELRQVVRVTYGVGTMFFLVALVVGLLAPPALGILVGDAFVSAGEFVLLLALGNAFYGGYRLVVGYLFYMEHTRIIALITAATALTNAGANYVLILHYGAIGAAYATLLAYALSLVLVWAASARAFPMPWLAPRG